ncbi:MAG: MMPL family transporter, partial [Cyclobacteriaceae bacterium]|nr:MMPL family transporter [Cyclobacteriaceae bacterium]
QLTHLAFDYEFENFFPLDDPELAYYKEFSEKFGNDNDYLLIGLENKKGIFQHSFLSKVNELTNDLNNLNETNKVLSITNSKKIVSTPLGLVDIPRLHLNDPEKKLKDSISLIEDEYYKSTFFSKDQNGLRIILFHKRIFDNNKSDEFVFAIDSLVNKYNFDKSHIAGKVKAQYVYVTMVKKDFARFLVISTIIILIMLIIFVRKPILIFSTFLVSVLSILCTLGFMSLTGKKIDLLSSLIPTILIVVAMSNIIHLFSIIKSKLGGEGVVFEKLKEAIKEIGFATFLTSTTTALGFLTLILIKVAPIIELGLYAAAGILIAFMLTYLIFPACVVLSNTSFKYKYTISINNPLMASLFIKIIQFQKAIISGFVLMVIIFIFGISRLEVNSFLIDDLPDNSTLKKDFVYFDNQYAGARPWVLSLWIKDTGQSIYSEEVIKEIDKIERTAKEIIELNGIVSPVSYVKFANQTYHNGSSYYYKLPDTKRDWNRSLNFIKKQKTEERFIKVTDGADARLLGFTPDIGSKLSNQNNARFIEALDKTVNKELVGYSITGTSHLIDKSHGLLSMKLIKGIISAMLLVGIIAGLLFRSWRMTIITLIPNIFPILATAAVMGYFNIPIKLSTSIIFAISFGIVVDDTIHFLSKFRHEKKAGSNNIYALKRTILTTGKPIIITTIILSLGFIVFCLSDFGVTYHIGLFVSISFIVALIADLLLLPVLILW